MFYLGCHLSSSGGYLAMGETAVSINANTFQYFTRNPRGGAFSLGNIWNLGGLLLMLDRAKENRQRSSA
jgi:endonuclease IV